MAQTFVRNFEIESINKTLKMQQKTVGDVSCVIWDAAIVLSKYLEILCAANKDYIKSKTIIELGAGLGCFGLVASCFGAHVTMTDLPEALDNLSHNIEYNKDVWEPCGGSARAQALTWGSQQLDNFSTPDFLVATDCVYYQESVQPLVDTLVKLSSPDTQVIICQEERDTEKQTAAWQSFTHLFHKHFDVNKVPLDEQHSLYSTEEIVILRAKKKTELT